MISNLIFWCSLGIAFIFMIVYFIWLSNPGAIIKNDSYPDYVSLPDGSILSVVNYPKIKSLNDLPEKGIYKDDLIMCDPEGSHAKIHVHDTVVYKDDYLYVVDTCHKDGTYTLKRTGEKQERINKADIKLVAKYGIKFPYDDIVDVVL